MTLNGAIAELVMLHEHSMMPDVFKPSIQNIIETVSECEEPSAQQWIPCSERLPEEEKIYLVTYSNGIVGTSSWHKDTKCNLGFDGVMNGILDDGRTVVYSVVAWLPLPEPFKEDRDD